MEVKKRGRKPIQDKKQLVNLFIRQSIIEKHGGLEKIKELLLNHLNQQS